MSHTTSRAHADDPGDPQPGSRLLSQIAVRRGLAVIACALIVGVTFVASYVGALHKPTFHNVPIAVAGPRALARNLGRGPELSVTAVASAQIAIRRVDDRSDFGAVVASRSRITLYTAEAAGQSVAAALTSTLPAALRAATAGRVPIRVIDLKPLPRSDPTGVVSFYLVLSLVVSNYLGAILFALAFGTKLTRETLLPRVLVAVFIALVAAVGEVGIVNAIGPLGGHFVTLALAAFLLGVTVAAVTMCLQALLGVIGTTLAIVLFVVLGNPASGGAFPFPLLPGVWRWLGPYTPSGAGVTLIRDIAYFGGNATGQAIVVLAVWLAVALVLTVGSVRLPPIGLRMKSDYDRLAANPRTV